MDDVVKWAAAVWGHVVADRSLCEFILAVWKQSSQKESLALSYIYIEISKRSCIRRKSNNMNCVYGMILHRKL